ncbi:magnesium-translocating P-type ATPase [Marinobacter caseinilyticus]|uniref:magnesium-translocating P-type ATPase n=1 Tax=Marinobacter caseinilyticus TaxID=2692195 RepID=UPI00140BD71F|nr:magnesium-translocating P-type ATPase [Marinobacter caseinilyticus]
MVGENKRQHAYWSQQPEQLLAQLETSQYGLSTEAVERRRGAAERRQLQRKAGPSPVKILIRQFRSPLVLILVFGALISMVVRDWVDATIILALVLGSALLGFYQEYQASVSLAALRRRLALTLQVLRDGKAASIDADRIVPGDVVLLSAGNLVPADGIILEARDFLVTESALTGESFPVEKRPGVVTPSTPLGQRTNCVYLGSSARSGTARMLVVTIGRDTAFGEISERLGEQPPETDFSRGVRQFGFLLLRVLVVLVVFVMAVNYLLERPMIESMLYAIAIAAGMSPELLPVIVSVTLSSGARAMARRGVIVRHLESIENLGSIDVLCTDKTGTLTEGVITLSAAVDCAGTLSPDVRRLALFNSLLETGIENPLDAAVIRACQDDLPKLVLPRKVDEIPYDFSRRRLTIVVADSTDLSRHLIITKGAFTNVLEACTCHSDGGVNTPLNSEHRARLTSWFEAQGKDGCRVLAVATRSVAARNGYTWEDEKTMTLQGFLLFFDPPKAGVADTIAALARLGIRIKVITGDNRFVTAHLAESLKLSPQAMITGAELASMSDKTLWECVEDVDLFVEVDPQQKELIVRALQHAGHAVGYLGDGINDVPALHSADVGISVDDAVDVARESASVILLEPTLDVLCDGVMEGRRTFMNTLKYIGITTSANFGNMVSMSLMTPLLPFLPLLPKQILLNNFLSDLPSLAIATDQVDIDDRAYPKRWDVRALRRYMLTFGLISTVFDLITFFILLHVFTAGEATFHTAWFVASLITELAVVLVLRTHHAMWRSRPSRLLVVATLLVFIVALMVPYLPALNWLLGFVSLPLGMVVSLLGITVGYIATTELVKRRYFA